MAETMTPSPALLCKLGSIAVHAEDFYSPDGHHFDLGALKALLNDREVKDWLREMDAMAMLPKKRRGETPS